MRRCSTCHTPITAQRLTALPNTHVCVSCSEEQPVKGFMTWEHKTAPTFQVVTPRQHEWFQRYDRKRPSASLPMSNKTASALMQTGVSSVAAQPSFVSSQSATAEDATSLIPRARCGHADRPQVSPSGKCVECAIAYYALRAKWAAPRQTGGK